MSKLKEMKSKPKDEKPFDFTYILLGGLVLIVLGVIYLFFFVQPAVANLVSETDPFKGPIDSKVVFVEFSDFQCPACGAAFPTIKRLSDEYSDRVKFVYKDFPLSTIHPFAQKAAEAAQCALEQLKFWEYHDTLFANQEKLTVTDLKQYAVTLGLDSAQFNECLDSAKYSSRVSEDFAAGQKVGVNGTPTFFINGVKYSNMAYEQFKQILDAELAK